MTFVLLVFAFVLAVLATFIGPFAYAGVRVHLGWAAIAFFMASMVFGHGAH